MRKLIFVLLVMILSGCGKRGPLIPPEAQVPAAVSDLSVRQQGSVVTVSWSAPTKSVGGKPLDGIALYRVYRREVLPPAEDCEGCPGQYRLVKTVDPAYLEDVSRSGNSFSYTESVPSDNRTWQYRVVAVDRGGSESALSKPVRFSALPAPSPPLLTAVSGIEGIRLSWAPVPPQEGKAVAFVLSRKKKGEKEFARIATLPGEETTYLDQRVELQAPFRYVVQSVVEARGFRAVSDPSEEAEGKIDIPAIQVPEKPQL
jgi:predicted small lipoprotein YifL